MLPSELARKGLSVGGSPLLLKTGIQGCWSTSGCCTKMDCWVLHNSSLAMGKLGASRWQGGLHLLYLLLVSSAELFGCCPAGSWSSATPCCFPWHYNSFQTGMLGICHAGHVARLSSARGCSQLCKLKRCWLGHL